MAERIRVSVIIPARNEAQFVEAALQSVADQFYPTHLLECVVVDNGSSDGTADRVHAFAERRKEMRVVVVAEPMPGVARAKNRGGEAATGDVLLFLDADSRLEATLVPDVVALYACGEPTGSMRIKADSGHPIDRGFFRLMEVGPVLFGVRGQMLYMDRCLFLALGGFRSDYNLGEDLDLLRRAREKLRPAGKSVAYVSSSAILTSPRRLRTYPFHLAVITIFVRWVMAFVGIGRRRRY